MTWRRISPTVYMGAVFVFLGVLGRASLAGSDALIGFSPVSGFAAAVLCLHWERRRGLVARLGVLGLGLAVALAAPPGMAVLFVAGVAIESLVAGHLLRRRVDPLARPETAEWWIWWASSVIAATLLGSLPFAVGAAMIGGMPVPQIMAQWLTGHAGGMLIVAPGVWAAVRWYRTGGSHHRGDLQQLVMAVGVISLASGLGAWSGYVLGRLEPLVLPALALGWLAMTAGHRVTVMASSAVATTVLLAIPWWGQLHPVSVTSATLLIVLGHAGASGLAIESSGRWHARALLAGVVDIATEAVLIVDSEGRVMVGNPAARSLFGESLEGRAVSSLLPGLRRDWIERRPSGETVDGRSASGRRIPVEITAGLANVPGRPMMALVCRDMTEAKDAAAALRRAAEVIDASPILVGWTDREGSLLFLNRAGRDMMGAADDEVVDSWAAAGLVTKEAFEAANEHGSWSGETWLLLRNGARLPVAQTVIAHLGDDGSVRYYSILATDLSERFQLENMRSEFLSNVTHDLRSPLTAVLGYVQLLRQGHFGDLASDVMDALADIDTASTHMLDLINDLLDLWRAESGKAGDASEFSVGEAIEAAVRTISPVAVAKSVSLTIRADEVAVVGDRKQIERALLNVVGNAVKYTPKGGQVSVTAEAVDGKARVEVADTGVGIPPSELDAVFERFYRASTAERAGIPGTGLGLPLVREVIVAHGGEVGIRSEVGVGTTMVLEFPVLTRPANTRELAAARASG